MQQWMPTILKANKRSARLRSSSSWDIVLVSEVSRPQRLSYINSGIKSSWRIEMMCRLTSLFLCEANLMLI